MPRESILSFEEIVKVAESAVSLGVNRFRITGGEPLQRRGVVDLVAKLRAIPGVEGIGLTTNAERLAPMAKNLFEAGVDKVNISIDTLNPERFHRLTRVDRLQQVLEGIEAAGALGFRSRKLNCVPLRGVNDDELAELLSFAKESGFELRFIEFMPFGSNWSQSQVLSDVEVLAAIEAVHGRARLLPRIPGDTSRRYRLGDGTLFGIIPTSSSPFCGDCDRLRLTADGQLMSCLFADKGVDVRALLRSGATLEELTGAFWRSLEEKGMGYMAELARGERFADPERNMKRIGG